MWQDGDGDGGGDCDDGDGDADKPEDHRLDLAFLSEGLELVEELCEDSDENRQWRAHRGGELGEREDGAELFLADVLRHEPEADDGVDEVTDAQRGEEEDRVPPEVAEAGVKAGEQCLNV